MLFEHFHLLKVHDQNTKIINSYSSLASVTDKPLYESDIKGLV